jgi:hypothetical protein
MRKVRATEKADTPDYTYLRECLQKLDTGFDDYVGNIRDRVISNMYTTLRDKLINEWEIK